MQATKIVDCFLNGSGTYTSNLVAFQIIFLNYQFFESQIDL